MLAGSAASASTTPSAAPIEAVLGNSLSNSPSNSVSKAAQPQLHATTRLVVDRLTQALNSDEASELLYKLDYEAFAQQLLAAVPDTVATSADAGGLGENANYLHAFLDGVLQRFAGAQWILQGSQQIELPYEDYLSIAARYRVAMGDNMFFIDVHQLFGADGELKMLDFYNRITEVSAMEYWSNLVALTGEQVNSEKVVRPLRKLFDAMTTARPEDAYTHFESLPANLRHNKFLIVAVIEAAEKIVDSKERLRVLKIMDTKYVAGSQKILLQYYIETQQASHARLALQDFSNNAGEDSWLQAFEAGVLLQLGDTSAAYQRYANVLNDDPDSEDVYFNLLDHFIKKRQYADAMLVVRCLYSRFDVYLEREKLQAMSGYQDFLAYQPFNEWADYFEAD